MTAYYREMLDRYRAKGILIDTNLLLLYFVGSLGIEKISRFKRTKQFTTEDFYVLSNVIRYVGNVVTTPNILTEVSNLSWQLTEGQLAEYTKVLVRGIKVLREDYSPSTEIAGCKEIHKFGLTDAGIFLSAKNKYLVITDDFRLSQYLQSQKVDVINFNHIRSINW